MKYKEIAEKKIPDLVTQVEKVQKDLSQLMLDIRMGKSNKTSKIKSIKKDLARLLTAKKQQELRVGK